MENWEDKYRLGEDLGGLLCEGGRSSSLTDGVLPDPAKKL